MDFDRGRAQEILKGAGLATNGPKEDLRYFLEEGLKEGLLTAAPLESKVLEWEPWTHRHYYFVKCSRDRLAAIGDSAGLLALLKRAGIESRMKTTGKFYLPSSLKVDRLFIEDGKLVIILVAPMITHERLHSADRYEGDLIYEVKRRKTSRKAYMIELNLRTGRGFLSVPALTVLKGRTYAAEFAAVEKLVNSIVDIGSLEIASIGAAVENLMQDDHAVSHSLQVKFDTGHKMSLKSPKKGAAVFDGQKMKKIEKIARDGHYAEGAFYFLDKPDHPDFRFKIHGDHRLGIFTDLEESEARDVMALVLENL
ncbi:MAG: hypothetical protein AB7F86_07245 [Bdellovibrionales bacterium]